MGPEWFLLLVVAIAAAWLVQRRRARSAAHPAA
jgi:hypothetical protein